MKTGTDTKMKKGPGNNINRKISKQNGNEKRNRNDVLGRKKKDLNWVLSDGCLKTYTDVSLIQDDSWGLCVIVMKAEGQTISINSCRMQGGKDPLEAESMALKVGMVYAIHNDFTRMLFESDSRELM